MLHNKGNSENDTAEDIQGKWETLEFSYSIRILRINHDIDSAHPTHEVYAQSSKGDFIKVGAAWENPINKGPNAGKTMLSATIDDPSFEKPIHISFFENAPGEWTAQTSRLRQSNG